jgi:predicted MPP superfamily phosphohydrolase
MISRRGFFTWLGRLALAGAAAGTYAFAIEPGFLLRVQVHALTPPDWPAGFKLRIVALADIHMGEPYMPVRRLNAIVETANALAPDVIVLLGDYVAGHLFVTEKIPVAETARACLALRAPLGVFGILGNHDWWDDLAAQRTGKGPILHRRAFEDAGIPIFENEGVRLSKDGRPFWLLGLGDQAALKIGRGRFRGVDDLPATLALLTDDAPAIMLIHEPDAFAEMPKRISLTLAGHTHGGQVRLMGWSPIVPSMFGNRYAYGHILEENRHMIVSGGLGCSILPVRLGVPPEVNVINLGG